MIRKLNSSRSSIIDEIEKYYNDEYEIVEQIIEDVTGVNLSNDDVSDDNEEEGFYYNFSTEQLSAILREIQDYFNQEDNKNTIGTLAITKAEYDVLKDAMENYSDVSFSRDSEMAKTARKLLQKLNELYYL